MLFVMLPKVAVDLLLVVSTSICFIFNLHNGFTDFRFNSLFYSEIPAVVPKMILDMFLNIRWNQIEMNGTGQVNVTRTKSPPHTLALETRSPCGTQFLIEKCMKRVSFRFIAKEWRYFRLAGLKWWTTHVNREIKWHLLCYAVAVAVAGAHT